MARYRVISPPTSPRDLAKRRRDASGNALAGSFGAFLLAYVTAELILASQPHTLHWAIAVMGGVAGYSGVYLWLMRATTVAKGGTRRR